MTPRVRFARGRVFLVAVLTGTLLGSGTAQAHSNEEYREGWFRTDPELCVWGQMRQAHAYHTVTTSAWAGCATPKKTWFMQRQQYYKPRGGHQGSTADSAGGTRARPVTATTGTGSSTGTSGTCPATTVPS